MNKNINKFKIPYKTMLFLTLFLLAGFLVKNFYSKFYSKKSNNLFFKTLNNNIEKIKKITIDYKGEKLNVVSSEQGKWSIVEKNNFPAQTIKIKELIFGLADLKVIESKTSKQENFSLLELEDLEHNKQATKITLLDADDKEIDSVYIGKREFVANPNSEYFAHIFVRRPSENQVWLVSGRLAEGFAFKDLVLQPIMSIDLSKISEITLSKPKNNNNPIKISRDLSTGDCKLIDLPPNYKIKDQYIIDNIIQQFSYLSYEDVIKDHAEAIKVLNGQILFAKFPKESPEHVNTNKDYKPELLKHNFDLVYFNKNYYLRIYTSDNTKHSSQNSSNKSMTDGWLYKISDYAYQSLLVDKKDLITIKQ